MQRCELARYGKVLIKYNISSSSTEPNHQDQNRCERHIQEVKKITTRLMDHTNTPDYSWYKALQYTLTTHNHILKPSLQNKPPIEKVFATTPDISASLQYSFYESIYYYDAEEIFPHSKEVPRRFLGLATNVGGALTYRVITVDNTILSQSVMQSVLDKY